MEQPSGGDADEGTLPPGTRLGKYEIVRLLGAGGMGAVYEAIHKEIDKHVAVKTLSPSVAAVSGARARFLREAQLTSRVRHPHIVDVTDMGAEGGVAYIVMELLRGEDLGQHLARIGPMRPADVADVLLPVCSAVMSAHQGGVIHRDLKPQNIFLAHDPAGIHPKVLDFGISKANDNVATAALTGTGAMVGTPYYLAPEQIQNARLAGPPSDQYSLGVILYECLTAHRPFDGETLFMIFQAIVAGSSVPPRAVREDIPPELEAVVLRAMQTDPQRRFPSVRELGRALLPFASTKARINWEEAFTGRPGEDIPLPPLGSRPMAPTTPLPPGITPLPPTAPGATPPPSLRTGGTRLYDSADALLPSAAASAAASSGGHRPRPSRSVDREASRSVEREFVQVGRRSGGGAGIIIAVVAVLVLAGGGVAFWLKPWDSGPKPAAETHATRTQATQQQPEPPPQTYRAVVVTDPPNAEIELDGVPIGRGSFDRSLPMNHVRHRLRVEAEGYETKILEFIDEPPNPRVALYQKAAPPPPPPPEPAKQESKPPRSGGHHHAPRDPGAPKQPGDGVPVFD
jgi:serine/threonine-protein kinase